MKYAENGCRNGFSNLQDKANRKKLLATAFLSGSAGVAELNEFTLVKYHLLNFTVLTKFPTGLCTIFSIYMKLTRATNHT